MSEKVKTLFAAVEEVLKERGELARVHEDIAKAKRDLAEVHRQIEETKGIRDKEVAATNLAVAERITAQEELEFKRRALNEIRAKAFTALHEVGAR